MSARRVIIVALVAVGLLLLNIARHPVGAQAVSLTPLEWLGKSIFFDANLSANRNQSCASCHDPNWGWSGPEPAVNAAGAVFEGSVAGLFGNRKPPSAAYAAFSPVLHGQYEQNELVFRGGNFWDGRATGERLHSATAEQAQGPFLNPVEQALAAPADVVARVCAADYADLFTALWGALSVIPRMCSRPMTLSRSLLPPTSPRTR